MIVAVLASYAALQQQVRSSTHDLGEIQAQQLLTLKKAVDSYVDLCRTQIATGSTVMTISGGTSQVLFAVSGEGSAQRPTTAQLKALQLLPADYVERSVAMSGGNYLTRLNVLPAECLSIDPNTCRLEGHVFYNKPMARSGDDINAGQFDGQMLGDALNKLGGGGFATVTKGTQAVSAGGDFQVNLTGEFTGTVPAGILGVRVGNYANNMANPVAGVDFCPGNAAQIYWYNASNTPECGSSSGNMCVVTTVKPTTTTKYCEANGYSNIPVGYSFTAADFDPQYLGSARVMCEKDPSRPGQLRTRYFLPNTSCKENKTTNSNG